MNDSDEANEYQVNNVNANNDDRRGFLSKLSAATLSAFTSFFAPLTSQPSNAVTNDPTRIEINVDTEYLLTVMNYFEGDMRKVLSTIVRSPLTTVEIEPPKYGATGAGYGDMSPKDAILRALYTYESPDEYAAQASWLKVDSPNPWIELLTKKRYELDIPILDAQDGDTKGKVRKIVIKPATTISLSNLEAVVGLAAASYPLAFAKYNFDSWQEEQEKEEKKKMMAAKKAKTAAVDKKKPKGTAKKEKAAVASGEGEDAGTAPPKKAAMKGQEAKSKPAPAKKAAPTTTDDEITMAPNAMTEALNEFFGNTESGPTARGEAVEEAQEQPEEPSVELLQPSQPDEPSYEMMDESSYYEQRRQQDLIDEMNEPQQVVRKQTPAYENSAWLQNGQSSSNSGPPKKYGLGAGGWKKNTSEENPSFAAQSVTYIEPAVEDVPTRTVSVAVSTSVETQSSGGMDAYAAQMAQLAGGYPQQQQEEVVEEHSATYEEPVQYYEEEEQQQQSKPTHENNAWQQNVAGPPKRYGIGSASWKKN